ncbi:MAG: SDR family oxidoreductase [Actinobacteria bacterium]|nr:SDR family oxidoreductase [Actinomycetota bacterium]MCA1719716.1 SDR family oxidoreductase [Actinomycetota bacterium]
MSKSVVVTGANSGIGLATVLELASAGYDVIGTVRSASKAALVQTGAADKGVTVRTVELDVNDAASTEAGFAQVEQMTGGQLWAVVNNAGYAQAGAVEDISDEQVRAQLETNLVAPIRIARLVLPGMKARGDGRIVNVSSVAGRLSTPLMGWYCASKHGLEAVTDALRMEVEADGVRVILVEPGMFGTDIWSAAGAGSLPDPSSARYAAAYARSEALSAQSKRLPDPVWVARTIRVALSNPLPMARYVVGADAVGGILAETLVPTVVTDYVKAFTTGLRELPMKIPFLK